MLPDLKSLDADALRALILTQQEELASRDTEIENLKLLVLKLKRLQFGRKSEKLDKQIEQLELRLEDLEANQTICPPSVTNSTTATVNKPARRPLPEHLPREVETYLPQQECCPDCGGRLRPLGEDVSEMAGVRASAIQSNPASSSKAELQRLRADCAGACAESSHRSRPGWTGAAGSRSGIEVCGPSSSLSTNGDLRAGRCGAGSIDTGRLGGGSEPSACAVGGGGASLCIGSGQDVLEAGKLHGDDIPVPVLAPGKGQTKTGRLWTYVRGDRPAGDTAAPAVWFAYSPDRKGEHPQKH